MKKDTTKKPFFARLLEEQELEQVSGGKTLKYPSDGDDTEPLVGETPPKVTQKFPSDKDEDGI
ncbi:microviridin/marinostatin family tricyclic proteinase inhibitor [Cystobacter fuscus]|uniref:microviridin/marinostatin family tricyclic proteinase inhibitor n=1 Tax=Cystobacter fuscus TaxID=43 RepID=UPI002B2A1DD5|nr:microviridin/marinostatin family tricyclic proteinase inhibitor [Cystobacter fuscus]